MVVPNMSKFFKRTFIKLKPEIASGVCPHCEDMSSFVSIVNDNYRCMNCGGDTEQKVNGVISYMPISSVGYGPTIKMEMESDEPKA